MKKVILMGLLLSALTVSAVERVSFEQLQSDWNRYINHTVQLTTPLVVCGSFYDSLILAPQRLFCPEEQAVGLADGDSTDYWRIVQANRDASICVHCKNAYYNVRTGDIVRGFQARVTSERHFVTGQPLKTRHAAPERLPKAHKGELRIVGANIENYFADLGGYAHKRTTPKQQAMKTRKLTAALLAMHADVFALCEMQVGDKAPQMLVEALNRHGNRYAYVIVPMDNMDRIGGCFIYNKERVRPYAKALSAFQDTTSHYYTRMFAQGFEELASGQRLIISLNHFKSKRPGRYQYDTNLRRMENADSLLAMLPKAVTLYGDSDILLVGDYNCYTQEQPLQSIIRAGYADMLPHGLSHHYSYSFRAEAGYLDRCFASPSMASQIIQVRPWHINADWYYSHGAYKLRDKSLHRYADHDPIIIDVKLKGER